MNTGDDSRAGEAQGLREDASATPEDQGFMVMLVDDQAIVAERIRRDLLDSPQMDFHYCQDPHEALPVARLIRPTVILLDLLMPAVSGLDVVRAFREDPDTRHIPIIVLSTKEEPRIKAEAFAAGANDYLIKLPDREELNARILYHSRAYLARVQRDEAYRALRESQRKLEQKNFELLRMSNVDGLTQVANRRRFDELIQEAWAHSRRTRSSLALVMVDIDCFKPFNDLYGHLDGDDCLKRVAQTLQQELPRMTDFLARYGGEEFAVVLSSTDLPGATRVAERLRQAVEALHIPHACSEAGDFVTISLGVAATHASSASQPQALVAAADKMLYQAKHLGRNQVAGLDCILSTEAVS
jgi:two-component system chemotaxis family response regulator WspR